jgi:hypothetical protein
MVNADAAMMAIEGLISSVTASVEKMLMDAMGCIVGCC